MKIIREGDMSIELSEKEEEVFEYWNGGIYEDIHSSGDFDEEFEDAAKSLEAKINILFLRSGKELK
tara:strand:- start:438 stop:635 length:198 start_codon:yes stop_codon:yes gene_type:complete